MTESVTGTTVLLANGPTDSSEERAVVAGNGTPSKSRTVLPYSSRVNRLMGTPPSVSFVQLRACVVVELPPSAPTPPPAPEAELAEGRGDPSSPMTPAHAATVSAKETGMMLRTRTSLPVEREKPTIAVECL